MEARGRLGVLLNNWVKSSCIVVTRACFNRRKRDQEVLALFTGKLSHFHLVSSVRAKHSPWWHLFDPSTAWGFLLALVEYPPWFSLLVCWFCGLLFWRGFSDKKCVKEWSGFVGFFLWCTRNQQGRRSLMVVGGHPRWRNRGSCQSVSAGLAFKLVLPLWLARF